MEFYREFPARPGKGELMSPKIFNVGVVGLVHDHCWHEIEMCKNVPSVTLTAVADKNPPLLKRAVDKHGFHRSYRDWR